MRILRLKRQGTLWALLQLEDGTTLRCPLAVAADFRLHKGQELSAEQLQELEEASLRWLIRHRALRLLARRAHSREELRRKLLHRFPTAHSLIDVLLQQLEEEGYLDDRAYAEAFVRQWLERKPAAPARLVAELRHRGIPPESAQEVVARILPQTAVLEQARRAAQRKLRLLRHKPIARQRQALLGYLSRQGFPAAVIRHILHDSFPELPDEE